MTEHYYGSTPDETGEVIRRTPLEIDPEKIQHYLCLHCTSCKRSTQEPVVNNTVEFHGCQRTKRSSSTVRCDLTTGTHREEGLGFREIACEMQPVCSFQKTRVTLRDLLVVPGEWEVAIQEDTDYTSYLDLDMELELRLIPDPALYRKWEEIRQKAIQEQEREKEIHYLEKRLKELRENGSH